MQILTPQNWTDYELLDSGNGMKLERYGKYTVSRPDPQIIWQPHLPQNIWDSADATFTRTHEDKGIWKFQSKMDQKWLCNYQRLSFWVKLSPFKHTGVFPEQAIHWEWIKERLEGVEGKEGLGRQPKVLNLFGYTGIASLAAAAAGAEVTHVDASYPTIGYFKENIAASHLEKAKIRYIEEDVLKFCEREARRGAKYDAIIMDPPAFGHGPAGEVWQFNKSFPKLMAVCKELLSDKPLFIIINAYAISTSAITLENMLLDWKLGGKIESGELALAEKDTGRLLSTGIFARWSKN